MWAAVSKRGSGKTEHDFAYIDATSLESIIVSVGCLARSCDWKCTIHFGEITILFYSEGISEMWGPEKSPFESPRKNMFWGALWR